MRDPRGGTGIHLQLEGDGAWPDLNIARVEKARAISVAVLAKGTQQGHASLMFRFDYGGSRTLLAEMTLRELHSIYRPIIARFGEDWMKPESSDLESRLAFTVEELVKQLVEARAKLGLPSTIDMTAADAAYDAAKKAEGRA